jgi:hypothetical protein
MVYRTSARQLIPDSNITTTGSKKTPTCSEFPFTSKMMTEHENKSRLAHGADKSDRISMTFFNNAAAIFGAESSIN